MAPDATNARKIREPFDDPLALARETTNEEESLDYEGSLREEFASFGSVCRQR